METSAALVLLVVVAYAVWIAVEMRRPDPPQPRKIPKVRGSCLDCEGYVPLTDHGTCGRCGSASVVVTTWSGPDPVSILATAHEHPLVESRVQP